MRKLLLLLPLLAFLGCNSQQEEKLSPVLTIEGANHRIAQTIVSNTKAKNQQILVLDSLQSTTAQDAEDGVTYLSVMERNLSVLKQALA